MFAIVFAAATLASGSESGMRTSTAIPCSRPSPPLPSRSAERIEAWRPLIESTADEDEREALIEDAQADLARAIEEMEGIDEDEYYAIYEAAREDEALRNRINEILSAHLQRPQVPRAE